MWNSAPAPTRGHPATPASGGGGQHPWAAKGPTPQSTWEPWLEQAQAELPGEWPRGYSGPPCGAGVCGAELRSGNREGS